ncbi:hypothetical protein BC830DRAFT_1167313 [Chytriomyces sp. MP71]|nr:hypothetical protein BC830DRAFT_1167313 [Chytriomyces sp. MP71]
MTSIEGEDSFADEFGEETMPRAGPTVSLNQGRAQSFLAVPVDHHRSLPHGAPHPISVIEEEEEEEDEEEDVKPSTSHSVSVAPSPVPDHRDSTDPVELMLGSIRINPGSPSPTPSTEADLQLLPNLRRSVILTPNRIPLASMDGPSASAHANTPHGGFHTQHSKRASVASFPDSFISTNSARNAKRRSFTAPTPAHGSFRSVSIVRNVHERISTSSFQIGEAVAFAASAVGERLGAGYSNNWAFGVFDKWWAVEPRQVRFEEAPKPSVTVQPRRQGEMKIPTSISFFGIEASSNLKPNSSDKSLFDTLKQEYPSDDSLEKQSPLTGSDEGGSPKRPPRRGRRLPYQTDTAHSDESDATDEDSASRGRSHKFSLPTVARQPSQGPRIELNNSPVLQSSVPPTPASETPSVMPFMKACCCPCLMFAENREMFARNGGNVDSDAVARCCGVSAGSSQFSRIMKSTLCFASVIPICMCSIPHRSLRTSIKERYSLLERDEDETDGECGECMLSGFCIPCALIQERREIVHWEGVVRDARKRRSYAF